VNWIGGVGVRPEALRLARDAPPNGQRRAATVLRSVFLGNCLQVHLQFEDGAAAVAESPRSAESYRSGESVYACWDRADEMAFPE